MGDKIQFYFNSFHLDKSRCKFRLMAYETQAISYTFYGLFVAVHNGERNNKARVPLCALMVKTYKERIHFERAVGAGSLGSACWILIPVRNR